MIGNDIVDLQYSRRQSEQRLDRIARRILIHSEYDFWRENGGACHLLWSLWALKESAYKLYFQQSLHRFFAPKKFYCNDCSKLEEAMTSQPYQVKIPIKGPNDMGDGYLSMTTQFVHAFFISHGVPKIKVQQQVFKIPSDISLQSKMVRGRFNQFLAEKFHTPIKDLKWSNHQGVPSVMLPGQAKPIRLSLSHHQQWGAFATVC